MEIGRRIKQMRHKMGMTAAQLATAAGVSPTSVSAWENTGVAPRGPTLMKVAEALQVTTTYLMTGRDDGGPAFETVQTILERAKVELSLSLDMPIERISLELKLWA